MNRPIRVLLADDEAMIRAGVRAILAADDGIEVVAEAGDSHEAVRLAQAHRPDVVLLDIRMPRLDGLAAAEEILRTVPGTAVAMLTTFSEDTYVSWTHEGESRAKEVMSRYHSSSAYVMVTDRTEGPPSVTPRSRRLPDLTKEQGCAGL